MSGGRDVNVTIFITFMSGNKSLTFFANPFFHFKRSSRLRLAFDATERNKISTAYNDIEVKRAATEKREKDEYFSAEQWESK